MLLSNVVSSIYVMAIRSKWSDGDYRNILPFLIQGTCIVGFFKDHQIFFSHYIPSSQIIRMDFFKCSTIPNSKNGYSWITKTLQNNVYSTSMPPIEIQTLGVTFFISPDSFNRHIYKHKRHNRITHSTINMIIISVITLDGVIEVLHSCDRILNAHITTRSASVAGQHTGYHIIHSTNAHNVHNSVLNPHHMCGL